MLCLLASILLLQNVFIGDQLQGIKLWQAMVERRYDAPSGMKVAPLEVTKIVTMTVTKTATSGSSPTNRHQSAIDSLPASSSTSPPTILLSTPESEQQAGTQSTSLSETRRFDVDLSSLVPSIYVPFKWRAQIQVEDVKKYLASGWTRLKRIAVVILHWPLPVAEDAT